jgi:lysophospholipase L1-like esterase
MDEWRHVTHAAITSDSIVIIGDSITANAPFPDHICGHPIVKAGYGGTGANDFLVLSRTILQDTNPDMVVVALGANDRKAPHLADDYRTLLGQLASYTSKITAVSNTADPNVRDVQRKAAASLGIPYREIDVTGLMPDQIHFNADGYQQWIPTITGMICSRIAEAK